MGISASEVAVVLGDVRESSAGNCGAVAVGVVAVA